MYGLTVYMEPKDVLERLNEQDKERFNQCVFTDARRCRDGTLEIDCILFNDPDAPRPVRDNRVKINPIDDAFSSNNEEHPVKRGRWVYWGGWSGNHDMRIDNAVCSECGYKHHTVRWENGDPRGEAAYEAVLNKLSNKCPKCGALMQKE